MEKGPWAGFLRFYLDEERRKFKFEDEVKTAQLTLSGKQSKKTINGFLNGLKNVAMLEEGPSNLSREEGNAKFKLPGKENLAEAAKEYTNAICAAPAKSRALALAHGNRAAALYKLGKFEAAYIDCQCALDLNHPRPNVILLRQAACARSMSDASKLAACIEDMNKLKIDVKSTMEELYSDLNKIKENTSTTDTADTSNEFPNFTEKQHTVVTSKRDGRHVVADEPIKRGDIIAADEPFTFAPSFEQQDRFMNDSPFVCDHCFEENIILFPCNSCQKVLYCSPKCREEHLSIHATECPGYQIYLFYQVGPVMHLALRIMLKAVARILGIMCQKQRETGAKPLNNAQQLWIRILNKMRDEKLIDVPVNYKNIPAANIFRHAQTASLMCAFLASKTSFFETTRGQRLKIMSSDNEWEFIITAMLLRIACQLSVSNTQKFTVFCIDDPLLPEILPAGQMSEHLQFEYPFIALYPRMVAFSHSCAPNIEMTVVKGKCFAVATQDIEAGQKISVSYGTIGARTLPRTDRRAMLKEKYGLNCNCSECDRGSDDLYEYCNRVICRRNTCKQIFVPYTIGECKCPACGEKQTRKLFQMLEENVLRQHDESVKTYLYITAVYFDLCHYLPLHTIGRYYLGIQILQSYVGCDSESSRNDDTLSRRMLKIALELCDSQETLMSLGPKFIQSSMFAIDIIALRKAKGLEKIETGDLLEKVKRALVLVSPKIKRLLVNYIEEYTN